MFQFHFIQNFPGFFVLICAVLSNIVAQMFKFIQYRLHYKKWEVAVLFTNGGMPSSHTAFVCGGMFAIAVVSGVHSIYFALSFMLAAVTMQDAFGIRREAGKQAKVVNAMLVDLSEVFASIQEGGIFDNPAYDKKLKELLGHEPIEILGGIGLSGIITTLCYIVLY